jgi:hypothetical protein
LVTEECVAKRTAVGRHHPHDIAGLRVDRCDVTPVDPRMTGPNPILTASGYDC